MSNNKPRFVIWRVGLAYHGGKGIDHQRYDTRTDAVTAMRQIKGVIPFEVRVWRKRDAATD